MTDNGGNKNIRYNVGGQIFEVSHDIVSRHPTTILAKTALAYPQNSSTAVIFIAGDAERFSYVFEYLRTGRTVLPFHVPKAAFLQDLAYYGFQNIDPNNVNAISASANAVEQVAKLGEYCKQDLKELDAEIAILQLKRSCSFVAYQCFLHYIQHGVTKNFRLDESSGDDIKRCFSNLKKDLLNEKLALYGLEYISHQGYGGNTTKMFVTMALRKLSEK